MPMAIAAEGRTEADMMAEFERTVVSGGGRPMMTQIFFGGNGSTGFVRGREKQTVLTRGEVIRFDVGCTLEGYNSDIARNYSLGEPKVGDRAKRYYEAILAAETAAIETMKPGVPASEVFHAGIKAARVDSASTPYDLAPTLAAALGIKLPDAVGTNRLAR